MSDQPTDDGHVCSGCGGIQFTLAATLKAFSVSGGQSRTVVAEHWECLGCGDVYYTIDQIRAISNALARGTNGDLDVGT